MFDKRVITAVHALSEHRSFKMAAEMMGTSAASFSRYIQEAEKFAGQQLFERSKTGAFPTAAGRHFLQFTNDFEDAVTQFEANCEKLRMQGPDLLKIGCGPLATRKIISPVLGNMMQLEPDLRALVNVRANKDPLLDLRTGALDVAVCDLTHTPDLSGFEIMMLRKEPVSFWTRVGHPLQKRGPVSLADVFRSKIATPHLHAHWKASIARVLGGKTKDWSLVKHLPHIESDDFSLLVDLTSTTDVICVGMQEEFEKHRVLGAVKRLATKEKLNWNICAVKRSDCSFPALDLFWDQLAMHYSEEASVKPQTLTLASANA